METKMKTKPSTIGMMRINQKLYEISHELQRLKGWSEAEIKDQNLGKHLDELKAHIDNAIGRCSSTIMAIRLVK